MELCYQGEGRGPGRLSPLKTLHQVGENSLSADKEFFVGPVAWPLSAGIIRVPNSSNQKDGVSPFLVTHFNFLKLKEVLPRNGVRSRHPCLYINEAAKENVDVTVNIYRLRQYKHTFCLYDGNVQTFYMLRPCRTGIIIIFEARK